MDGGRTEEAKRGATEFPFAPIGGESQIFSGLRSDRDGKVRRLEVQSAEILPIRKCSQPLQTRKEGGIVRVPGGHSSLTSLPVALSKFMRLP